jgi:putative ABC transport system substrate-binding protein
MDCSRNPFQLSPEWELLKVRRRQSKALLEYGTVAHALKVQLQSVEVHGPNPNWELLFETARKSHVDGLILVRTSLLTSRYAKQIAELAIKNRFPSAHEYSGYVEVGGLMSYAANDAENFRRAATYVDKILKGSNPSTLPVEQPIKFELVINLKTAKQIGLTIPPNVLARADRVIK